MIQASICTIGDEILIGQIVDTNSSGIASKLEELGIRVTRMLSIGDSREDIIGSLREELSTHEIVIATGGLGPTKDDITKAALAELSGSKRYVRNETQAEIITEFLHGRGLDVLDINRAQADVPDDDLGDGDRVQDIRLSGPAAHILVRLVGEIEGPLDRGKFRRTGAPLPRHFLQLGIFAGDNLVIFSGKLGKTHSASFTG